MTRNIALGVLAIYLLSKYKKKNQSAATRIITQTVVAEDGEKFTIGFDGTRYFFDQNNNGRTIEERGYNGSDSFIVLENGKQYGMDINPTTKKITIYEG